MQKERKTTIRTITVGGHTYRQRAWYEWDSDRKRSVTHVVEHLGAVSPLRPRHRAPPSIEGIETVCPAGHLALFHSLSLQFGLKECLDAACPSEGGRVANAVMALVFNQLNSRRPLEQVGQWIDESPLGSWMGASDMTKDDLTVALDTIYSRSEIAVRRVAAIQSMATKRWKAVAGRDSSRYFIYYDVCRIRYNETVRKYCVNT